MDFKPVHMRTYDLEARQKMGTFLGDRPFGVALLQLRKASLSLSGGHPGLDYRGMKPKKKPSDILITFIWFLILTGAVLIVWTLALGAVLFHAVFIA